MATPPDPDFPLALRAGLENLVVTPGGLPQTACQGVGSSESSLFCWIWPNSDILASWTARISAPELRRHRAWGSHEATLMERTVMVSLPAVLEGQMSIGPSFCDGGCSKGMDSLCLGGLHGHNLIYCLFVQYNIIVVKAIIC